MKNKKCKHPSIFKWIVQVILSVFLFTYLFAEISIIFDYVREDDRKDKWMLLDLREGRYAECVDTFHMLRSDREFDSPEFEMFKEFEKFYTNYILYVETVHAQNFNHNSELQAESREYLSRMNEIFSNSGFNELIPHYKRLFERIQKQL